MTGWLAGWLTSSHQSVLSSCTWDKIRRGGSLHYHLPLIETHEWFLRWFGTETIRLLNHMASHPHVTCLSGCVKDQKEKPIWIGSREARIWIKLRTAIKFYLWSTAHQSALTTVWRHLIWKDILLKHAPRFCFIQIKNMRSFYSFSVWGVLVAAEWRWLN